VSSWPGVRPMCCLRLDLPAIVTVRNDPAVQEALNNGHVLRLEDEKAPAVKDLEELQRLILGIEELPAAPRNKKTFGRFLQALGLG
jgi:Flp pilus assembly CpaE family ATPase